MLDITKHAFSPLGDPLGEGGSAIVYKAVAEEGNALSVDPGHTVAAKVFKDTVLQVPNQLARIYQEADVGSRIAHPNVARAYGLVEESAGAALILEWIDGSTLEAWVQRQRKDFAWSRAKAVALDLVEGVAALHAEGVFHRDIKPENIIIRAEQAAVLMDIGVAEIADDNEHTLHTELKDFLGSVRYASPQFILGEPFQAVDDVYSLGLTLYYLFSGIRPYEKIQRKPVLPIRVVEAPPVIERLRTNVPKSIKILLQACVHRDRARRPSLAAIKDSIVDPEGSPFLTEELERQAAEGRSYRVLKVMDNGATFYADLAGDEPALEREYTVVRPEGMLQVPSYQREVATERWVATAILKHMNQNVGFFKVLGQRWEEPRGGVSAALAGFTGRWVEYEKQTDKVQVGDLVLKDRVEGH